MKVLLVVALSSLLLFASAAKPYKEDEEEKILDKIKSFTDGFFGFFYALFSEMDQPQVAGCVDNVNVLYSIIEEIQVMVDEGVTLKKVMNTTVDSIIFIVAAYEDCRYFPNIYEDFVDIYESIITDPSAFGLKMLKNAVSVGIDMYADISNLISYFDNENWSSFGKTIGRMFYELLLEGID